MVMTDRQPQQEGLCEALGIVRAALDTLHELPLPEAQTAGAAICELASRLERPLQHLSRDEAPLFNALGVVQVRLAEIGELLQMPGDLDDSEEDAS
jgi:hypothetical protein